MKYENAFQDKLPSSPEAPFHDTDYEFSRKIERMRFRPALLQAFFHAKQLRYICGKIVNLLHFHLK